MLNRNFFKLSNKKFSCAFYNTHRNKSVKTGIVMLNMGGPQNNDQVQDYLYRIMTDTDMIQLPLQKFLGPFIAKKRTPAVQKKYNEIGGSSPILKWTNIQGELLCKKLDDICPKSAPHKHYVAFRYVSPFTEDTLQQIENDKVERIILFSQYPQYSCATSGSSFNTIYSYYKRKPFPQSIKWSIIDRWGTHPLLVKTFAEKIVDELNQFPETIRSKVVIIFSAHSLPIEAVNRGDSYPSEVAATTEAVMAKLGYRNPYVLTWQSRVGPVSWLGPFTDVAIEEYVKKGIKNFILVPIAFVNEHIETLHEMDIEYCQDLGKKVGVELIRRVAAPNDHPLFIEALSDLVSRHLCGEESINPKFLLRCPSCTNVRCHESKQWFHKLCSV
ncbi:hypothetical protein PGB90_000515 [Kerria lacca]